MEDLLYYIVVFIATIISVGVLGLVAGFSPTLYIAQIAAVSKSKRRVAYTLSVAGGVLAAIALLVLLFQTFHLNTLINIIDTTVQAIVVSLVFNILVGTGFIFGGIWYLSHQSLPSPKPGKIKKSSGLLGIFGFGFIRTITSISGLTATYLAGNIIGNISMGITERFIYTAIFLATTITPFVIIFEYMKKKPDALAVWVDRVRRLLSRFNYRPVVGAIAIILGASIIIINVMLALFY